MTRLCRIAGCDKPTVQRSPLCAMHRSRQTRYGDPMQERAKPHEKDLPCIVNSCSEPRAGKGLCKRHHQQKRRRGDPCAPRLKGRPWTAEEDRKLLDLPRYPRSGMTRRGELEALALHLGRSVSACASRLCKLRRERGY